MKIEDIRKTYSIIVNSREEYLEVLGYLKSIEEEVNPNLLYTINWDKICYRDNVWQLTSDSDKEYSLTSITFDKLKELSIEKNEWKPEIGDWVVVLTNEKGGQHVIGNAYKITGTGYSPNFQLDGIDKYGQKDYWYYSEDCIRKAESHEIPTESKNIMEDLIKEATKKYPIGTKFKPAHVNSSEYCVITDDSKFRIDGDIIYSELSNGLISDSSNNPKYGNCCYNRVIYYNGIWAEIIEQKEPKYISNPFPTDKEYFTARVVKDIYKSDIKVSGSLPFIIPKDTIMWFSIKHLTNIKNKEGVVLPERNRFGANIPADYFELIEVYNPTIESKPNEETESVKKEIIFEIGKWYKYDGWYIKLKEIKNTIFYASETIDYNGKYNKRKNFACGEANLRKVKLEDLSEIQQYLPDGHEDKIPMEKTQFLKGEYIVTLKGDFLGTDCAKENYCFKQRENSTHINPVIDLMGNRENGNILQTFNKKNHLKDWRYATSEEIEVYETLGRPYNVTTIQSKTFKEGDKVKIINRLPGNTTGTEDYSGKGDIGKIGVITQLNDSYYRVCDDVKYYGLFTKNELELYSEPNQEETLLEKGKRLYPIGTKYIPLTSDNEKYDIEGEVNHFVENGTGLDFGLGYVYLKKYDKWAEIVKEAITEPEKKEVEFVLNPAVEEPITKNPIENGVELIPGNYYYYNNGIGGIIFEFKQKNEDGDYWKYSVINEIKLNAKVFRLKDDWDLNGFELRPATEDEIQHCKQCKAAGEYVEYNPNFKIYDESNVSYKLIDLALGSFTDSIDDGKHLKPINEIKTIQVKKLEIY